MRDKARQMNYLMLLKNAALGSSLHWPTSLYQQIDRQEINFPSFSLSKQWAARAGGSLLWL